MLIGGGEGGHFKGGGRGTLRAGAGGHEGRGPGDIQGGGRGTLRVGAGGRGPYQDLKKDLQMSF